MTGNIANSSSVVCPQGVLKHQSKLSPLLIKERNHQSYAVLYSHVNIPHLTGREVKGAGLVSHLSQQPLLPRGEVGLEISILNIVFVC